MATSPIDGSSALAFGTTTDDARWRRRRRCRPFSNRSGARSPPSPIIRPKLSPVLINEYLPGAGIGWHRDKPQFGEVVGVSLLAPCLLRFGRKLERRWERASVPIAPRSAYRLAGPSRSVWEHSIAPLDRLRYSITFRAVAAAVRAA
jgi:hypothetical protein